MTAELVPAANVAAIEALDPEQRAVAVTRMLSEARSWLAHAMEATEPAAISEFKAAMATVAEATKQLGLSKGIQLDAQEMVRRAERGLGVAIREGQERGEIRSAADTHMPGVRNRGVQDTSVLSPSTFASKTELANSKGTGIYALTDNVSDEQFEQAIDAARAEGNLSRANVARKATGTAPRPASRHELLRGTRRIDVNRVIEQAVMQVANPCPAGLFAELDWSQLDHSKVGEWVASLTESISALRSLRTTLTRETTQHG